MKKTIMKGEAINPDRERIQLLVSQNGGQVMNKNFVIGLLLGTVLAFILAQGVLGVNAAGTSGIGRYVNFYKASSLLDTKTGVLYVRRCWSARCRPSKALDRKADNLPLWDWLPYSSPVPR